MIFRIHNITFPLNDIEYINFPFRECRADLCMGDKLRVYLCNKKKKRPYQLCSTQEVIWSAVIDFKSHIEAVLQGMCEIVPEWQDRIGYLCNQRSNRLIEASDPELKVKDEGGLVWLGFTYQMWCDAYMPATLLYTHKGEIIFEVIPIYSVRKYKVSYKVFIRNYRSYVKRILPRAVVEEWLKKITEISEIMLANNAEQVRLRDRA